MRDFGGVVGNRGVWGRREGEGGALVVREGDVGHWVRAEEWADDGEGDVIGEDYADDED